MMIYIAVADWGLPIRPPSAFDLLWITVGVQVWSGTTSEIVETARPVFVGSLLYPKAGGSGIQSGIPSIDAAKRFNRVQHATAVIWKMLLVARNASSDCTSWSC